jgi:hypothetical protein
LAAVGAWTRFRKAGRNGHLDGGDRIIPETRMGGDIYMDREVQMGEWKEDERMVAAIAFRQTTDTWEEQHDGRADPREPLWRECLACHRNGTIDATDYDKSRWQCAACGWSGSALEVWDYQTDLLLHLHETGCPPVVLGLLERCGRLLRLVSQGDAAAVAESGAAVRHAASVLSFYGAREPWLDDVE